MKFNLGDKVRIKSNDIIGIIVSRGYNEYLDENDKEQSFIEYQIEADKYYQCNEDEIELSNPIIEVTKDTMDKIYDGILNIKPISNNRIKYEIDNDGNMFKLEGVKCDYYYPSVQEIDVEDNEIIKKEKPINSFMEEYKKIVTDTMKLCERKNNDYGSSVQDTFKKFGDISYLTRIADKYNRICSLINKENEVKDESILDTIKDMGNYCFLWCASKSLDNKGDK